MATLLLRPPRGNLAGLRLFAAFRDGDQTSLGRGFPLGRCVLLLLFVAGWFAGSVFAASRAPAPRPNVILVITDDQGYGDVGAHGNQMIQTPNLDRLFSQSVRLTDFHVDPTCSPSRSALMTGRYSTRTGVWHTIMGRSMMAAEERTLAEIFRDSGYRTGMFGKWHLGDNVPCRPQDQGFETAFYHGGGGVTQTPDFFGNDYFDDTYFRNGMPEKTEGYCTDVWFTDALKFIDQQAAAGEPFFAYLATNAPHGPYLVADKYAQPYRDRGVSKPMAEFYGMITNIDENLGRLMRRLDALEIADNTIVIFMTDNGTAAGMRGSGTWKGFNAGMRGAKGSEYDGGHRVPCYIRWPQGKLDGGRDVDLLAAHIDILPTLIELCGLSGEAIRPAAGRPRDGRSLAPQLRGSADRPERTLLVHSQRIEHPEKWRKSAVMTKRWRLVNGKELYDMAADPGQQQDVAGEQAEVVAKLRRAYDQWWTSLEPVFPNYVRIHLGDPAENPVHMTCHDWHTNDGPVPWNQGMIRRGPLANGFWAVQVQQAGEYQLTLRRWPDGVAKPLEATRAKVQVGEQVAEVEVAPEAEEAVLRLKLPAGPARLQTWLSLPNGKQRGAYFVAVNPVKSGVGKAAPPRGPLPAADPEDVGLSAAKLRKVDEIMQRRVDRQRLAGALVMIARRGKVAYFKSFGQMDRETERAMQKDTIFRVFSMTKAVTTVAAMMLVEEGKLQLDAPLARYLPELDDLQVQTDQGLVPAIRPPTVADLMRHTAGFGYANTPDSPVSQLYREQNLLDRDTTLSDMVGKLKSLPLYHQPGGQWLYGIGVDVLGRVVEVASGVSLDAFFRSRVCEPLGMVDTGFWVPPEKAPRLAANYQWTPRTGLTLANSPADSKYLERPRFYSGGGGLVSTADDYMRFLLMLAQGGEFQGRRYLKPETVATMIQNQLPRELKAIAFGDEVRRGVGFGYGFSVRIADSNWDPAARIGEYGWGGAASTHYWISPKDDLVVLTLEQTVPYSFATEFALKGPIYDALD